MRRRGLLAGAALLPLAARAQGFPQRPVRLIVPYGTGNLTDIAGRALAEALSGLWPQRVMVDNLPGAGGMLGVAVTRGALAVLPGLAARNLAELAVEARRTGPLFYYSAGSGTLPQLNMEMLKAALGDPPLEHVPYRTSAAGLADLLAGRVQLTMDAAGVTLPAILDGRLRALFWNGPRHDPRLPDVPTAAEALTGVDLANPWLGLIAPRGTPSAVLARVGADLATSMAAPGFAARLGDGFEALGGGPEPLTRQLRQDHARFGALIARLGIKAE